MIVISAVMLCIGSGLLYTKLGGMCIEYFAIYWLLMLGGMFIGFNK